MFLLLNEQQQYQDFLPCYWCDFIPDHDFMLLYILPILAIFAFIMVDKRSDGYVAARLWKNPPQQSCQLGFVWNLYLYLHLVFAFLACNLYLTRVFVCVFCICACIAGQGYFKKESPITKLSSWICMYFVFVFTFSFCISHLYFVFCICSCIEMRGCFKKNPPQQSCQVGGAIVVSTTNPSPKLSHSMKYRGAMLRFLTQWNLHELC